MSCVASPFVSGNDALKDSSSASDRVNNPLNAWLGLNAVWAPRLISLLVNTSGENYDKLVASLRLFVEASCEGIGLGELSNHISFSKFINK